MPSKLLIFLKSKRNFKRVIVNTAWLFLDRIFQKGIGLFVAVWLARYLSVEQYGAYNFAIAFTGLFVPFSILGLQENIVRRLVETPGSREEILGTAFVLRIFGGILMFVLALVGIIYLRPNDYLSIILVVTFASAGLFQSLEVIDLWFQSQLQSKYSVIAKNFSFGITALGKILLILFSSPVTVFARITVLGTIVTSIGLATFYQFQKMSLLSWKWSTLLAKELLQEGWHLMLSGLTIIIYMKVDQIMIGQMVNDQMVGLYSSAVKLSEVWYFIPTAIVSSMAPGIYEAKASDDILYYRRTHQLIKMMSIIAIVIAVPMTFVADDIVILLFGQSYAQAGAILAIHIWAALFVFMGVAERIWFIAEGLTHLALYKTLLGSVTNIALNIILIPKYGAMGAAVATVIAQVVSCFLSNALHPRCQKLFWIQCKCLLPFRLTV